MWRKKIFKFSEIYAKVLFLLLDFVTITVSLYLALAIRWGNQKGINIVEFLDGFTGANIFTYLSYFISFYLFNFYDNRQDYVKREKVAVSVIAIISAATLAMVIAFFLPHFKQFRTILLLQTGFMLVFMTSFGIRVRSYIRRANLVYTKKVIIIGSGRSAKVMIDLLQSDHFTEYQVIGYLSDTDQKLIGCKKLGCVKDTIKVVSEYSVNLVISCVTYAESTKYLKQMFRVKVMGCDVMDMPVIYSKLSGKVPVQYVGDEWFVYGPYFLGQGHSLYFNLTRFIDMSLALIVFVLTMPLQLFCILMIKLTMPGPIFYYQTRLGMNKVPYRIIKFRSMSIDAEKKSGPSMSKGDQDARITAFGRIMRKTRLDELPQLINVLKGEMSFIGPRPERPYYVEKLSKKIPYYGLRFAVKPGLTGWAQVNLRYDEKWEENAIEKLQYELYYIQESSIFLNIIILLKTLQTVVSRPGS